ncbi:hypothetical protein GCM10007939_10550 [Amylibacter marinus]|uniref:Uncharacterized protein n=1 Tax=Amylibacter marinus TaxID=1475483 RepID=A0ABQ5VUB6_9RHOB|nr:hypothetical protein [Amylibacter marinus]GLQ34772.1 hypothetical protein GCM10007939_10550 [Amylibacter marinus]
MAVPAFADLQGDLSKLKIKTETCVEKQRNLCVVSASTQVLTSSRNLEHLFKNDPELVEWYVKIFQKASFEVAKDGRAPYRKFLSENATWALDFHSELRKFLGELPLGARRMDIAFAGYGVIRADACREIKIEHCAIAATRSVHLAHKREYWDQVIQRFEMKEPFVTILPAALIAQYEEML